MSKEYHVFTEKSNKYEQAFIFEINRENEEYMELDELWIVSNIDGRELKTRLKLKEMIMKIGTTIGGNVPDDNIPELVDVFREVLSEEKQLELQLELCEREIDKEENSVDKLLKANEFTEILFDVDNGQKLQTMVDKILTKKLNK